MSVSEFYQRLTRFPLNVRDRSGLASMLSHTGLPSLSKLEPMRSCGSLGSPFCECFCVPLPGSGVLWLPTPAPEEDTPGSGSCFSKCQGTRDNPPTHLVHDRNVGPSSLASLSGHLRCGTDPEESAEVTLLGLGLRLCLAPSSLHAPPGSTSWEITPTCTPAQYIRVFVQGAWLGGNLMR